MGENDHKPETSHGVTTGQDEPRRRRKRPKRERLMSSTGITIFVMINGFIVIIAAVMILGAIIVQYSSKQMEDQLKPLYTALAQAVEDAHMPDLKLYTDMPGRVALGFLISGIALFIISLLGCCASANHNRSLLIFYGIFLGSVLLVQCILMILLFSVKKELNEAMKQPMMENIKTHYGGDNKQDVASYGWNFIMATFQCCGVDNYTDLHRATQWDRRTIIHGYQYLKEIPMSCCLHDVNLMLNKKLTNIKDRNCTIHPTPHNSYINKPCWPSIQHAISDQSALMMSVGVCVFGFQIFLVVINIYLCNNAQKKVKK